MDMRVVERIFSAMRGLLRNESGSTVTFLAAAIVPLVAFSGLSIDTARGYLVKQRLAYSIEAAALAAAKADPGSTEAEIEAIGNKYFNANFPSGTMAIGAPEVTYTISANKREITVVAKADMPTALMTVVGINNVTVGSEATAQRQSKGLELAIALDNSISMNGYIDDLQDAVQQLLNVLYGGDDTVENLWVSVVPFDERVNLKDYTSNFSFSSSSYPNQVCPNPRSDPYTNSANSPSTASFTSRWLPTIGYHGSLNWNFGCQAAPAIGLTAEKSTVEDAVNAMGNTGSTRIDEGATWVYRMLSPEWRGLWGNSELPLDYNTALMDKVAIIMTDGINNPQDGYVRKYREYPAYQRLHGNEE